MVRKIFKYLSAFFIWLSVIALSAHQIIPHDHHLSGTVGGLKNSCHSSDDRSHSHPLFPAHCHAFNDLAAEKFSRIIIKQEIQTSFASIIWYSDYILPDLNLSLLIIDINGKPFPVIHIPDFSPFRAPPSLS